MVPIISISASYLRCPRLFCLLFVIFLFFFLLVILFVTNVSHLYSLKKKKKKETEKIIRYSPVQWIQMPSFYPRTPPGKVLHNIWCMKMKFFCFFRITTHQFWRITRWCMELLMSTYPNSLINMAHLCCKYH